MIPAANPYVAAAAALIRSGQLVAFPTETVYGLGANALDATAVGRIYEAKGRPATSPVIVHVDSVAMARTVVSEWPDEADRLAARFWPGALTLVLPKSSLVPDRVTAGLPTVGVRMPDHPLALELITTAGVPIAAPSANRFTALSPTTAEHVRQGLGDRVSLVLDGGPTRVGIESTILSLAGAKPVLLRPGMVSRAELESVIGSIALFAPSPSQQLGQPAPGLHPKHYSPKTPLILLDAKAPVPPGRGIVAQMPDEPVAFAAVLYSTLHALDAQGWDWIAIRRPADSREWSAILDRLQRAAS